MVIAGSYSPPFGEWPEDEFERICEMIRCSRASLIWVGLGCPKQEHWIARHKDRLPPGVYFGIGAAFAFHAGEVSQRETAPEIRTRVGVPDCRRAPAPAQTLPRPQQPFRFLFPARPRPGQTVCPMTKFPSRPLSAIRSAFVLNTGVGSPAMTYLQSNLKSQSDRLSMVGACPVCGGRKLSDTVALYDLPVDIGRLWSDRESAQAATRGDVVLAFCHGCGFVFNSAYDATKLDYQPGYEYSLTSFAQASCVSGTNGRSPDRKVRFAWQGRC